MLDAEVARATTRGPSPHGPVTLSDVSRHVGVSAQSVSNALHNPGRVAPDTRERILSAVRELGYRPNRSARALRCQRSRLIGVKVEASRDDRAALLLDQFLHALAESAASADCHLILCQADGETEEISAYRELLDTTSVDAFVLASTHAGGARVSALRDWDVRAAISPLGAGALAGSSLRVDPVATATELGFRSAAANSIDAVSDRDFAAEFVHAASLIMMHLSRLAEDVILYTTTEFGFFELSDAVATGSSLMPQKKNPDSMELVRGKTGRVFGNLMGLLTMLKGLPMAYNKDMQEDKEAVFDACDTTRDCLQITATVLRNLRVLEEKMKTAAIEGYLNATELADYLSKKGVPFRRAHEIAGRIVLRAIETKVELNDLQLSEMQKYSPVIESDIYDALSLQQTLRTKNAIGGTAPEQVEKALQKAKLYLTRK